MSRRFILGLAVLLVFLASPGPMEAGMGREALKGLDTVTVQTMVCPPVQNALGEGALKNVITEQLILFGIKTSEDAQGPRLVAVIDCSSAEIVPGRNFWRLELTLLDAVTLVRDPSVRVPVAQVWNTPGVNGLSEPGKVPEDVARGVEQVLGDFLADHQALNPRGQ